MPRLVPILVLVLLLVPAHRPVFAATASLAKLNVQVSELPAGATLFSDQALMTPAAVAKADQVSASTYVTAGVLRADERVFVGGTKKAQTLVLAEVYALTSATAAHGFYARQLRLARGKYTRSPLKPIGDEGMDFNGTDSSNGKPAPANAAIFRRGVYVVLLGIEPLTKSFPGSEVIHLANLVDTRIQRTTAM